MEEVEATVTGKVHGVNFRHFAKQKATGLGVMGFVENSKDFSVRAVAQGTEENLQCFIEHLHKGPFNAKVHSVDVVWREPNEKFRGFEIRY